MDQEKGFPSQMTRPFPEQQSNTVIPPNAATVHSSSSGGGGGGLSYCESMQKNKPQSNSVAGGLLLLTLSGMHIAWGIWRTIFFDRWIVGLPVVDVFVFVLGVWYIGALFGSLAGPSISNTYTKKVIYLMCGLLLALQSIIYIVWYNEWPAILIGRLIAGFAHGILYVTTIRHASENVVKEIRGMVLSSINLMILLGMLLGIVFPVIFADLDTIDPNMLLGILGLVYVALAMLMARFLTYESNVFLLKRGRDNECLTNMIKLRSETIETWSIRNEFSELRLMVSEDRQRNQNIFQDGNVTPLLLVMAVKINFVLSNNMTLNFILIIFTDLIIPSYGIFYTQYGGLILIGIRLLISPIVIFTADYFGRKKHLAVSGMGTGISMALLAIVLAAAERSNVSIYVPFIFCAGIQIFSSIGIAPMQHVLEGEAFSTAKSGWSIACLTSVEYVMQFLFIYIANYGVLITPPSIYAVLYVSAIFTILTTIFIYWKLPETRGMSLRQARNEFIGGQVGQTIYSGNNVTNSGEGITYT